MNFKDDPLLLHAAFDGELDAAGMLQFEAALAQDPSLKREHDRLAALRGAVRRAAAHDRAPDALRDRIAALAEAPDSSAPARGGRVAAIRRFAPGANWRALAASALIGAGLAGAVTSSVLRPTSVAAPDETILDRLIDGHRRALLSGQPFDVASSDRHTVKPWFNRRFALAPFVADLAPEGFSLVGGRVEVIDGRPAPTLIYRHNEHLISLTALPAAGPAPAADAAAPAGYSALSWRLSGVDYWAISDIDRPELEAFRRAFAAAAHDPAAAGGAGEP